MIAAIIKLSRCFKITLYLLRSIFLVYEQRLIIRTFTSTIQRFGRYAVLIFSSFFLFNIPVLSQNAENGIIDLSSYSFEQNGVIELNGNWDFYLWKFIDPQQPGYNEIAFPQTLYTPNRKVILFQSNPNIPAISYGTYRLKIILNQKYVASESRLSIFVPSIISSYKMWINTELKIQKGLSNKIELVSKPHIEPCIVTFVPQSDTITITIHFQNKTFPSTVGIIIPVSLGFENDIFYKEKTREYFYLSCAVLCYTISFFFVLLIFLGKEKKVSLLGIAFCIVMGTRYLVDEAYIITYIIPNFDAEIMIKMSLISVVFFGFITAMGHINFPQEISKKTMRFVFATYFLYALWLTFIPTTISGLITPYILFFSVVLTGFLAVKMFPAVKAKKEAAGFFMGLLFFTLIIVPLNYFVLKSNIPLAGIAHVLLFTGFVTKKLSLAQIKVIQLSKDLKSINENLELIVEERTKELNIANKSLEKLNYAKDRFIGILSHDLRNPLNYLVGITKRLVSSAKAKNYEQTIDYCLLVNESAVKGYNLAENLLDWSLMQSGSKGIEAKKIDLKPFVHNSIEFHRNEYSLKNISAINKIEERNYVLADPRMLESILRNLLTNALKYTHENGTVEITSERKDRYIKVMIKDNGVGIPSNNLEDLFRIDKKVYTLGTNNEPGSGFGLIITKEFVEQNGGTININSKHGCGTEVSFTLKVFEEVNKEN
jgi:signal transduction histidine kinase